jgi:alkylated DNA repair dioxygenase AlkB
MSEQLNLLAPEWPPGFNYFPDFISPEEEASLISYAKQLAWENYEMHGVIARRKVYRFGVNYAYEGDDAEVRPLPDELKAIIEKGASALKIPSNEIVQMLFNHYPVGAPIGWHRDAPMFEKLVGISLAGFCTMKLKPYDERVSPVRKIELAPRSAYIMTGDSRWKWEHHIPPVKEERFSITMRTMVKEK